MNKTLQSVQDVLLSIKLAAKNGHLQPGMSTISDLVGVALGQIGRVVNRYDSEDRVKQVSMVRAGPMKYACYQLRDIETGEFGPLQFHFTIDNTVIAVMGESAFKLFARFGNDDLARQAGTWVDPHAAHRKPVTSEQGPEPRMMVS
jgi:hypothetical protein